MLVKFFAYGNNVKFAFLRVFLYVPGAIQVSGYPLFIGGVSCIGQNAAGVAIRMATARFVK